MHQGNSLVVICTLRLLRLHINKYQGILQIQAYFMFSMSMYVSTMIIIDTNSIPLKVGRPMGDYLWCWWSMVLSRLQLVELCTYQETGADWLGYTYDSTTRHSQNRERTRICDHGDLWCWCSCNY